MTKLDDMQGNKRAVPTLKRCAIYARYSSDMQRETSIEDQVRKCREYAVKQGWLVVEDYVRFDQAASGTSLSGRDGISSLVAAAEERPRPFDVLLIDDSSRLARNLIDGLTIVRRLIFLGVSVVSVSQGISSGDKSGSQLFTLFGMMDEQHIQGHADRVRRGQEGRVLKRCVPGGRCYGYRNVPIEDPTRKGDYGRPYVIEVHREIVEEEAAVVREMFGMYASGYSFDQIAQHLRAKQARPPFPPRRNSIRAWSTEGISSMLLNEKYIGLHIWKRTTTVRDEAGRIETRATPEEDWVKCQVPEWRIVSDELWNKVQEQRARKNKIGIRKLGGTERTKRSQTYLFSGLLVCGSCEQAISIVDCGIDGTNVRYGCGLHRYKGACANVATIRRENLEGEIVGWLTRDLSQGDRLEQIANCFHAKLEARIAELQSEARKNAISKPELLKERAEKVQEAWALTDFIVAHGSQASPTVQTRLAAAEARVKEIDERLAIAKEPDAITFTAAQIAEHLREKMSSLQSVLTSEPLVGKQTIRKHIRKITLTPGELEGKRVFYAAVEFELGGGNSGVVLTESMDASMQQYGFSTITITGPTLDACRVYRKRSQGTEHGVTVLPTPIADGTDATQASDSALRGIHA